MNSSKVGKVNFDEANNENSLISCSYDKHNPIGINKD